MNIKLTDEQLEKLKEDMFLEIDIGEEQNLYFEFFEDLSFLYCEITQRKIPGRRKSYSFSEEELELLIPKKPTNPSLYSNDPLCPNCMAYMIYKFECCPKCGQRLDWRERD